MKFSNSGWQHFNAHECSSICFHPEARPDRSLCVCSATVQSVLRESQVICQSKDKQIEELKKMSDQSSDSLRNEWEKKVWEESSSLPQQHERRLERGRRLAWYKQGLLLVI